MMNWENYLKIQSSYDGDKFGIRSPFQRDRDKIVFSKAFRRLSHKTQVYATSEKNSHYQKTGVALHNRLTHSIEVETVGRSLGFIFAEKMNEINKKPGLRFHTSILEPHEISYIVQAACLAHDLGNPALGHDGEKIIKKFAETHKQALSKLLTEGQLNDLLYFDGNALGFHLLTRSPEFVSTENTTKISYPTLASCIKYPWGSSDENAKKKQKFSVLSEDMEIFEEIFSLLELNASQKQRHPLSYLMELADDICYSIIDIEDGVNAGLVEEIDALAVFGDFIGRSTDILHKARAMAINDAIYQGVHSILRCDFDASPSLNELLSDTKLGRFLDQSKSIAKEKIYHSSFSKERISSSTGIKLNSLLEGSLQSPTPYQAILYLASLSDVDIENHT